MRSQIKHVFPGSSDIPYDASGNHVPASAGLVWFLNIRVQGLMLVTLLAEFVKLRRHLLPSPLRITWLLDGLLDGSSEWA